MENRSILIVGKKGILHWQEDLKEAFLRLGCRCEVFYVNPASWTEWKHKKKVGGIPFMSDAFRERFRNAVLCCQPQLILFLNMFILPQYFSEFINQIAPHKSLVTAGWMADCVARISKSEWGLFDQLYYFDSHMKPLLEKLYGDDTNISFLPLAVNENKYFDQKKERNDRILFAGTC